jgi:hypothetical protein
MKSKFAKQLNYVEFLGRKGEKGGEAKNCHLYRILALNLWNNLAPSSRLARGIFSSLQLPWYDGRIEVAQKMAGHSNAKTAGLYDRRNDDVSVGEVERIGI